MKRDFSLLQQQSYDLLVCGGGIYGAWTAYDAALRGLRVAIVEQGDWAGATSSASSKLIHGGLRYLESYDFKLVKKALTERQMLLQVAPHRIWPLRFGVPVYADSRISRLQLKLGLVIYDFLASISGSKMAHRYFNRQAFSTRFPLLGNSSLQAGLTYRQAFSIRFPLLDNSSLKGGFTYSDAQTDDARLVLELIAGAMKAGAVCVNYCKLTAVTEQNGKATGAKVQDQLGEETIEIQAKQIVYATGQWSATRTESANWCRVTKGVHLIMPAVLTDEALLLTAKHDGRVFFMIPWYGKTIVGTTDTDYRGDVNRLVVEPEEISYLLDAANCYLKKPWTSADVINSYAGLRVMKRSDKSSPSAVSRDWELKTGSNGVHYSIGGKITSAREDAANIVDRVCNELGVVAPCASKGRLFPWAPENDYSSWLAAMSNQAVKLNIDIESGLWLIRRHGVLVLEIFKDIENNPALAERITPALPFIYADLLFCARNEMVVHLEDILRRRIPLIILNKINNSELRRLATYVSDALGWDKEMIEREVASCLNHSR